MAGDDGKVAQAPADGAAAIQAEEPAAPARAEGKNAVPPAVSPALAAAVRRATAEAALSNAEGEDEFDAFPLPPEDRRQELEAVDAVVGDRTPVASSAPVAPTASAGAVAVQPVDEAITRFHREIGLLPTDEETGTPPDIAVVPPGGDGSDVGGGDGPEDAGGDDDGNQKRRGGMLNVEDRPMTIFEHLDELRQRLVWAGLAFVVGTGATLPFIVPILRWSLHNHSVKLQVIGPLEPMVAGVKLAILGGFILGSPVILYQAIAYVLPALTKRERRLLFSYLPAALVLFLAGLTFGLLVFEPLALHMAKTFLPATLVTYLPTLSNWINYLISFSVPFGLLFELPVLVSILVKLGIIVPETLAAGRRWAFLVAIIIAVMFAPPLDFIVTPTVVALPLYGLYELSIFVARVAYRQRLREQPPE